MTTTGRICPGKRSVFDDNCRERSPRATDLDSSFNFGSASETNDDDKEGILSVLIFLWQTLVHQNLRYLTRIQIILLIQKEKYGMKWNNQKKRVKKLKIAIQ